jgi:hypothetical protein
LARRKSLEAARSFDPCRCSITSGGNVTTRQFLSHFGFDTLRDLPDVERHEDAGLLNKQKLLTGALPGTSARPRISIEERAGEELETEDPRLALSSEDM